MKRNRKFFAALMMIMMLAAMTACGKDAAETQPTPAPSAAPTEAGLDVTPETTPEVTPEVTPETTPEAGEPYTVTLPDGTVLSFESVPDKIVSMGPNITELLYAVGAGDKVVGRTSYCDYPAEALSVEAVGDFYNPDIEKIVSLEPDVVIGSAHFSEEIEQQLTELGIQVAVLYDSSNLEGVYDIICAVGAISGCDETAEALAADTKKQIEAIEEAAAAAESKPSVYYVVDYGEWGDYTAGGDTFIGQMLKAAGGSNIAEEVSGWNYSLEALLEADPEIILIRIGGAEDFCAAEHYKELSAVKNGTVYEVDPNLLDRQGYRNADGLAAIVNILHPGLLTD